jgi:hypothetical protein
MGKFLSILSVYLKSRCLLSEDLWFLKNQPDLTVLRGTVTIQNGKDLFMFASSKLKNHKSSDNKQRLFRYTEIIDRNFPMHFKPISKIRAIHQTIVNSDGISTRSLSYLKSRCLLSEVLWFFSLLEANMNKSLPFWTVTVPLSTAKSVWFFIKPPTASWGPLAKQTLLW